MASSFRYFHVGELLLYSARYDDICWSEWVNQLFCGIGKTRIDRMEYNMVPSAIYEKWVWYLKVRIFQHNLAKFIWSMRIKSNGIWQVPYFHKRSGNLGGRQDEKNDVPDTFNSPMYFYNISHMFYYVYVLHLYLYEVLLKCHKQLYFIAIL